MAGSNKTRRCVAAAQKLRQYFDVHTNTVQSFPGPGPALRWPRCGALPTIPYGYRPGSGSPRSESPQFRAAGNAAPAVSFNF